MSHLLDVNMLLACGWSAHPAHAQANQWLNGLAGFCTAPITQMGFLRVSLSPAFGASFDDAQTILQDIIQLPSHRFLSDSVMANTLPSVGSGKHVTDAHLVRLAANHSLKLATFDLNLCKQTWATGIAENPL